MPGGGRTAFGGGEGFDLFVFADAFEPLADVDEGRHHGIARPQDPCDPCAEVRAGDRLRRNVAGVPVVLMPRVQDVAEIRQDVRADERSAVHDSRD